METNNSEVKRNLIIPETELAFRMRIIELYEEIYKQSLPANIIFLKYEDLKNFVLNSEKRIDFFSLSILKNYQDLIEVFDECFDTFTDFEKKELGNKTWYKATGCENLNPLKTLKYLQLDVPYDLLLNYSKTNCFNMKVLKFLVEELKVNVNSNYKDSKETPVLLFSLKCNDEAVIYLYQQGASILCKDYKSKNCIDYLFKFVEDHRLNDEEQKKANKLFNYLYTNGCPYSTEFTLILHYK